MDIHAHMQHVRFLAKSVYTIAQPGHEATWTAAARTAGSRTATKNYRFPFEASLSSHFQLLNSMNKS